MSFIWIYEYMKMPMSLKLCKSLFKLDETKKSPFITFSSINGSMVAYLDLNDLNDYKDKIIWFRVPNPREVFGIEQVLDFSRRERHAFFLLG